jgi:hypothetical protein
MSGAVVRDELCADLGHSRRADHNEKVRRMATSPPCSLAAASWP